MFSGYRLLAATWLVVSLAAQDTATVKGRLIAGSEMDLSAFVIEMTHLSTRQVLARIDVSMGGEFTVRQAPTGDYLARVTTLHGETVTQQFVSVNQSTYQLDLALPSRKVARPSGTTVSFRELRNPPQRKAIDASVAAQRFSEAGRYDKAAVELEKAVKLSPDYGVAHSNLGAQYLRLKRFHDAVAEIRRAIEISGPNANDYSNLAYALLWMEQFDEAIATAREALKLKKDSATAHHVLGLALALEPQTRGEGIAHLEEAAKTLEASRRTLKMLGQ